MASVPRRRPSRYAYATPVIEAALGFTVGEPFWTGAVGDVAVQLRGAV